MTTAKQAKPIWKCKVEGCRYTAEPTIEGYRKVAGHQLGHATVPKAKRGLYLVDQNTGEILAEKLDEATEKGFIAASPPKVTASESKPAPQSELPKLEESEAKQAGEEKKEITEPQVSPAGIFRYTISLPADAFTLYHLAKASGLEKDGEKPFDEWLWDCIVSRFRTDYKRQLVLAPIE